MGACNPAVDNSDLLEAIEKMAGDAGIKAESQVEPIEDDSHWAFLGIAHDVVKLNQDIRKASVENIPEYAYRVLMTIPGSAASRADLRKGDYILSYDNISLDDAPQKDRNSNLRDFLRSKKSVGDELNLIVLLVELEPY